MSGGLFGGRLALDGRYDLTTDPEALTGSLGADRRRRSADVLADLVGAPPVEGDAGISASTAKRSAQPSLAGPRRSRGRGAGRRTFRDGALVGLDLGEIGRRLARMEEAAGLSSPILRETIGSAPGRRFDAQVEPADNRVAGGRRPDRRPPGIRPPPLGESSGARQPGTCRAGPLDLGVEFQPCPPAGGRRSLGVRLTASVEGPGLRLAPAGPARSSSPAGRPRRWSSHSLADGRSVTSQDSTDRSKASVRRWVGRLRPRSPDPPAPAPRP